RENNTGGFPRGLAYMFGVIRDWIYGYNPIDGFRYEEDLASVKQLHASGGYFESLIQTYILDNQHRVAVILEPDPTLSAHLEEEEQQALIEARANMSLDDLEAIVENTRILKAKQVEPNAPEDLAKLPMLQISDLDKDVKTFPIEVEMEDGNEMLHHDLFTNGIVYFRLGIDLHVIPQDLLPYIPLFGASLTEIGTEKSSYIQLLQKIGQSTGGVGASEMVNNVRDQEKSLALFWIYGKSTVNQVDKMFNIMREMLFEVNFDNKERFRQMVLEEKAQEESRLIPAGHAVALTRLRAIYTEANWIAEQMGGLEYLYFLRRLANEVENNWDDVLAKLKKIQSLLLNRKIMFTDTTLDQPNYQQVKPSIIRFLDEMPQAEPVFQEWAIGSLPANEGLTVPTQVNYVSKGVNLYELGFENHGSLQVALNLIRTGHLWDKVRMQGGAYGSFIQFNSRSGLLGFVSYRDPNLSNTLSVYDETADYLRTLSLPQSEVDRAIIGVVGSLDSYKLPDAKGYTALIHHLHKTTVEERQQRRDEVLSTSLADIQRFAEAVDEIKKGRVVVLGSSEAVNGANGGDWMTITQVM
ncbi:MAG: peptidase M16, partial [Chloroflexota bacterium]